MLKSLFRSYSKCHHWFAVDLSIPSRERLWVSHRLKDYAATHKPLIQPSDYPSIFALDMLPSNPPRQYTCHWKQEKSLPHTSLNFNACLIHHNTVLSFSLLIWSTTATSINQTKIKLEWSWKYSRTEYEYNTKSNHRLKQQSIHIRLPVGSTFF